MAQEPLDEGVRPEVRKEVLELLTLMLAPMTPHLAEELWEMLGHEGGHVDSGAGRSLMRSWRRKTKWRSWCR